MAALGCHNKIFLLISRGLMSHFPANRRTKKFASSFVCTHGSNRSISITFRASVRRCWLPEYLIALNRTVFDVRQDKYCQCPWVRKEMMSANIFDDFECQECNSHQFSQASFQKPFANWKPLISMPFIAFQTIAVGRNYFETLIFARKKNNLNSYLKIVLGAVYYNFYEFKSVNAA